MLARSAPARCDANDGVVMGGNGVAMGRLACCPVAVAGPKINPRFGRKILNIQRHAINFPRNEELSPERRDRISAPCMGHLIPLFGLLSGVVTSTLFAYKILQEFGMVSKWYSNDSLIVCAVVF